MFNELTSALLPVQSSSVTLQASRWPIQLHTASRAISSSPDKCTEGTHQLRAEGGGGAEGLCTLRGPIPLHRAREPLTLLSLGRIPPRTAGGLSQNPDNLPSQEEVTGGSAFPPACGCSASLSHPSSPTGQRQTPRPREQQFVVNPRAETKSRRQCGPAKLGSSGLKSQSHR